MSTLNVVSLKASFVSFGKIDADRDAVIHAIIGLLGDPVSYETYEAARKLFGEVKREKNANVSDAAVNVAWGAFRASCSAYAKNAGFDFAWPEKPKSTRDAAVKKAAQRAVPESVAKAQSVAELEAITKPADAVEAAKLERAIADQKLKLVKAENKKAEDVQKEALKARRDAIIARIRAADIQALIEVEAMLDHDAAVIIAALPAVDVQKAVTKLAALIAKAPKPEQKKHTAKKLESAPF